MSESTDPTRPRVVTPEFARTLGVFNEAARTLQRMGHRIRRFDLPGNRLEIDPEAGKHLLSQRLLVGLQRHISAASTLYVAQFQGVTLEWRDPITTKPLDLSFH